MTTTPKSYPAVILSQFNFEQGEGKPPALIARCLDAVSSEAFKKGMEEKIRKFGVAIQEREGYHVVLRKQHVEGEDITVYYVDIREAKQSYVFLLNDFQVEFQIHREVV